RLGARLLLGPGLLPGGRLLGRGRLLGGRRGGRRGLRRRVLVALGLVLGEEVPPGGAHRLRVVEGLPVDLVDQPDVGAELRSTEPTPSSAPPSARDPGQVQFATDAAPLSSVASRAATARRARSMAASSSCSTVTMLVPASSVVS